MNQFLMLFYLLILEAFDEFKFLEVLFEPVLSMLLNKRKQDYLQLNVATIEPGKFSLKDFRRNFLLNQIFF